MSVFVAYYTSCVGQWRAPLELVRAGSALRLDLWLASVAAGLGFMRLHTYLSPTGRDTFVHGTTVRLLGLPLIHGEEAFSASADGRTGRMTGWRRGLPDPWRVHRFEGPIEVHEDALGASYVVPWHGGTVRQTARKVGEHELHLAQEGPGWRGTQRLRRG